MVYLGLGMLSEGALKDRELVLSVLSDVYLPRRF